MRHTDSRPKRTYRRLTEKEILLLETNGCRAESWEKIRVVAQFNPHRLTHVAFKGENFLGALTGRVYVPNTGYIDSGIHHAILDTVTVEDDVFIYKIGSRISGYHIEHHAVIDHVGELITENGCTFGNGVGVKTVNENGGRMIRIFDSMNSHTAYLQTTFRHRPKLVAALQDMAHQRAEEVSQVPGKIGAFASLRHTKIVRNVNIGPYSSIDGSSALIDGTILSSKDMPVTLGVNVYAKHFIIQEGSSVGYGSSLEHSFIGQSVKIEKQFSSVDSAAFAGSEFGHGEIASVFAGPFSVSHHKGTLLIACALSFFNAGSGTNMSNHMYKLGPNSQGLMERGCKTSSNVYLRWPKRIGAATVIMGEHVTPCDLHRFPFSYLVEIQQRSVLYPGRNIATIGMVRDMEKWKNRDVRKGAVIRDSLNFNLLNPMTMEALTEGAEFLKSLEEQGIKQSYDFDTFVINEKDRREGIRLYEQLLSSYIGGVVMEALAETGELSVNRRLSIITPEGNEAEPGKGPWTDLGGLIIPEIRLTSLIDQIESGRLNTSDQINAAIQETASCFPKDELSWCLSYIASVHGKPLAEFSHEELRKLFSRWQEAEQALYVRRFQDAGKEFGEAAMSGYGAYPGADAQVRRDDFDAVNGALEENPAILQMKSRLEHYVQTAETLKALLAIPVEQARPAAHQAGRS